MKFAIQLLNKRLETRSRARLRKRQSLRLTLGTIWQGLIAALVKPPELQVWCTTDRHGRLWWNAYDPHTGRSLTRVSEEQMRVWLEQRHLDSSPF
ncbi:MAG: hypothetical protein ACFB4I_17935 [Cyanophyceae cyanobacterium]